MENCIQTTWTKQCDFVRWTEKIASPEHSHQFERTQKITVQTISSNPALTPFKTVVS